MGVALRLSVALIAALPACSGTITFGSDRGDGGATVVDLGVAGPGPDAGAADTGPAGPADAGCRMRTEPPFPGTWPYARTKAAYQQQFWSSLPMRSGCSVVGCHAADPNTGQPLQAPLIPATDAELDDPAKLEVAIDQLWARTIPTAQRDAPGTKSSITWRHRAEAGGALPALTPAQSTFLEAYVRRSGQCGWVPIFQREDGGVAACGPDAGRVCDCPLPNIDLSACGR